MIANESASRRERPEVHRAEAQLAHLECGAAQSSVAHGGHPRARPRSAISRVGGPSDPHLVASGGASRQGRRRGSRSPARRAAWRWQGEAFGSTSGWPLRNAAAACTAASSSRSALIGNGRTASAGALGDRILVVIVRVEAGRREDPAVVGAAGPRAVLVDRAPLVDQHRAVAVLVVADQHVARGSRGAGNSSARRDVRERVGLVGPDVDELRRRAAGGAAVAGHVRAVLAAEGAARSRPATTRSRRPAGRCRRARSQSRDAGSARAMFAAQHRLQHRRGRPAHELGGRWTCETGDVGEPHEGLDPDGTADGEHQAVELIAGHAGT